MDPHSHRSHQNPSVQYLCFLPQSPSLISSNFQEHREHATPMKCAWSFRCTVNRACLETGPLSVRFDSLASAHQTLAIVPPASASQDRFSAVQRFSNRFIVHQEAWKRGTALGIGVPSC